MGGRQSWERHHRECGIGGGARSDELGRERVDRVQSQRGTVGVCWCDFADGEALQRSVYSLGHEDGTGNAEVRLGGDEACTAQVGVGADAFEHGGEGDEGHGVRVGEGVGAGLHGDGTGGGDRGLKVEYVLFFVVRDIFEIGIVVGAEAGIEEHLFWHGGDAALVEDIFKVLELVGCLVGVIIVLFGGGRGRERLTVRAYWRMSTSVMACLFSAMGAARTMAESSAGAAAIENFMVKKWVKDRRYRDSTAIIEEKQDEGRKMKSFHARYYVPQRYAPLHPSSSRERK